MKDDIKRKYVYKYWFPEDYSGTIYIVCPKDSSPSYDAYSWSDEFADIDSCGDKDLLLNVYGFVCKYYPKAKIERYYVDRYIAECSTYWKKNNMIILGGPAYPHEVCIEFMYRALRNMYRKSTGIDHPPVIHSLKNQQERWRRISVGSKSAPGICTGCSFLKEASDPSASCRDEHTFCIWREKGATPEFLDVECNHTLLVHDPSKSIKNLEKEVRNHLHEEEKGRLRKDGDNLYIDRCVSKDVGFFAAFENPYDDQHGTYSKTRVIMINGKHTFGGVGAFSAFDVEHNVISVENYKALEGFLNEKTKDFISYFHVDIDMNARTCTQCPILTERNFIALNCDMSRKSVTQREFDNRIGELKVKKANLEAKLKAIMELPSDGSNNKSKIQQEYRYLAQKAKETCDKLNYIDLFNCAELNTLIDAENQFDIIQKEWEKTKNGK